MRTGKTIACFLLANVDDIPQCVKPTPPIANANAFMHLPFS